MQTAIKELRARASQQMRQLISRIPDGTWYSEAYVDSDGVVDEPLVIKLKVEKAMIV